MSAHVPTNVSGGHHSNQNTEADVLVIPFAKGEVAIPGAYSDPLLQVPQHTPMFSQQGHFILKHILKIQKVTYKGI